MIDIQTTYIGEIAVLSVTGRMDGINAPRLQETLDTLYESRQRDIVLNLNGVDYMSAAALRVLRQLKERSGHVRIAAPSQRVREVMQITGLDAVYEMHRTQTAALHEARPIVNAHTHLEFGWLQHLCPDVRGMDFPTWIDERVDVAFKNLSPGWEKTFRQAAEDGIQQMIEAGITAVADITETGLCFQPLIDAGLHGIVYVEVIARTPEQITERWSRTRDVIETWRSRLPSRLQIGIAPHTPFTVSREMWDIVLDYAQKEALPLCIHVAESPAETEYMQHGTGVLAEYVDMPQGEGMSPVAFLEDIGALAQQPLLVHGVQVDDDDIQRIKAAGSAMVHCPRSNLRLRCGRMPLEKYLAAEIPVLLGTDSLASSPSLNIFDEMEIAVALHHGKVAPSEILSLVHGSLPHTKDES